MTETCYLFVIPIKKTLKSPEFLPLGILVVVGLILRFWNLAITEVAFDNATNTFRAVGWSGIQASFEAQGITPKQIIPDSLGAEAFRVYFVALR